MIGDKGPDMRLELVGIWMISAVEYKNALRNRLEPAQCAMIFSRQALGDAFERITVLHLYNVARGARDLDNDIRKRVGGC